jgi:hypothetical protein
MLLIISRIKEFTTKFLGETGVNKQLNEAGDDQTFDSEDRKGIYIPWTLPNIVGLLKYISKMGSGIDLVNVALPVSLNEPLSFLQRMCEQIAYYPLLDIV